MSSGGNLTLSPGTPGEGRGEGRGCAARDLAKPTRRREILSRNEAIGAGFLDPARKIVAPPTFPPRSAAEKWGQRITLNGGSDGAQIEIWKTNPPWHERPARLLLQQRTTW